LKRPDDVFTGPGELARQLGAWEVTVESARCRSGVVQVEDYPGGRPASVVELGGEGEVGFGEMVAFTEEEHRGFTARLPGLLPRRRGSVAELVPAEAAPYERAAIEGALIDLGLRQAGISLGQLWGAEESLLRWVVSFSAQADPRVAVATPAGGPELKLDVHEAWTEEVVADLRDRQRVVILDFKGQGTLALAERLSAAFPEAIFEDPPAGCRQRSIARDRTLATVEDVAAAVARGEWVNLKAPRMGGFLAVLRALAGAGARAYVGGMFEVGPGREQARQLAAMFCPEGPNDLAPFAGGRSSLQGPSPSSIRLGRPGFGSNLDWSSFLT
jgi:L-alanine-DL-glutamate epimerase-like enolase superfamily enzyme